MFDSNKALDKNILKSSLQILIEKIKNHDDNFLEKNSNDSTQIAGWSNA